MAGQETSVEHAQSPPGQLEAVALIAHCAACHQGLTSLQWVCSSGVVVVVVVGNGYVTDPTLFALSGHENPGPADKLGRGGAGGGGRGGGGGVIGPFFEKAIFQP